MGFLSSAVVALSESERINVTAWSSVYETEPMEVENQQFFLNMVVEVKMDLGPSQLLDRLKEIERSLGRKDKGKLEPRTIDLDLLLYGDLVLNEDSLIIPHPRMESRAFVLVPLAELTPDLMHPVSKTKVSDLLENCRHGKVDFLGSLDNSG